MRIFAGRLSSEFWQRVIKHVASMEDTCSLAVVNKYFYKLVNMDFKKLCYDHVLYRLKGETWAYAFSNFGTRVCSDTVGRMSILGTNVGFRIYSIKRRKFVFESEDLRWHMLNSVTIFHSVTKSFLVYNKQTDNWIEVKTYPEQLKLITPKNYLCGSRMRAKKVMEIYLNENNNRIYKHIFYRFDKDKIRVKTFDFESRDNHVNFHIWNLSKMTFPILKNREGDFYNCFTNLHIADEKVAVIYGRTGAMENYKFKLFI
ncbi:unnamed protein product [Bursaphelenchus okinawaensis]|uniref:F-box domain-containing protein n=1 Tax=Bursaphelenchus okinawaensis TaxID=465554 RepID=A0A811KD17_9BILA|nr:unnamed protein product [Bursaphelenchus okinawaensis]CAG9100764.1 unnamed protein product [Bursaphelenchus okinawaensis]